MIPNTFVRSFLLILLLIIPTTVVALPVTRVALFSSGVAYLEHTGSVTGDTDLKLWFPKEAVSDVFKSMIINDFDKGQVAGVELAANAPLERTLGSFRIDLSKDPALFDILMQLKGAQVIVAAPEPIKGRILNVEQHKILKDETESIVTQLNLYTKGMVRPIPLDTITSIELADKTLAAELDAALNSLMEAADRNRKAVQIKFRGSGTRKVRVGYVTEAPIWRTSYRLDLNDTESELQGWAIVENSTDTDWNDINLHLMGGRPISFKQDLYTSYYIDRPVVVDENLAPAPPLRHAAGKQLKKKGLAFDQAVIAEAMEAKPQIAPAPRGGITDGVISAASGDTVGELFAFTLKSPISLGRQKNALLPIIQQSIDAEKISVYNAATHLNHPYHGVRFDNSTELNLPAGPVTIYADGLYGGDARLGDLTTNEKALLSYAVDLKVKTTSEQKRQSQLTAKIVSGVLEEHRKTTFKQTYRLDNRDTAAKKMIIEHPITPGRKLVKPTTDMEKTTTHYRFTFELDPEKEQMFTVTEERADFQQIILLDTPLSRLRLWVQGDAAPELKEALTKVIGQRQEIAQLERNRSRQKTAREAIVADQSRIRENIDTTGSSSSLGKRYLEKLGKLETQLEEIDAEQKSLSAQIAQKRGELEKALKNLNVEL